LPEPELDAIMIEMNMKTETIENVLSEMADVGLIDNDTSKYNLANELRCWMGEDDFYKFLEHSCQVWSFDHLSEHFETDEK
jgi:hypothetical protein|tara:strand:+ start:3017 stop:3259 length:243 start_codon:yes stop_codon:yes gene_type:complete